MNNELLTKLNDAYDFLYITKAYNDLLRRFERDTESCKEKYLRIKNEKISSAPAYIIIFFVSAFMLMLGGLISSQIGSYTLMAVIFAVIITAIVITNITFKKKRMEPTQRAEEFWNTVGSPTCVENENKIEQLKNELIQFRAKNIHVIDFLPEDYREDINAVSYILYNVKNDLAGSVKEALHQYIEECHRIEVENAIHGMAKSMQMHNNLMEDYMSDLNRQQRIANSHLSNIETLTFLEYFK